jgi:hypothetical protein
MICVGLGCLPLACGGGGNVPPPPPDGECDTGRVILTATVSYSQDIQPLMDRRGCLTNGCHSGIVPSSDYDMTTYDACFQRGEQAAFLDLCPIVPGDPDASFMMNKLESPQPSMGEQMPLDLTNLTADELDMVRAWILEGAQNN